MSFIDALILGFIQGIAEFLPISSSTHLEIARRLLGLENHQNFLYFSLACHAGTMVSLSLYLWRDVMVVLKSFRLTLQFALALVPLIPVYLLSKSFLSAFNRPEYLGYGLLGTALLLWLAIWVKQENEEISPSGGTCKVPMAERIGHFAKHRTYEKIAEFGSRSEFCKSLSRLKWVDVLCIGLMQTLAFMPGISRSAASIFAARFRSWPWLDAARFSFLLAIPTILGGECLETYKLMKMEPDSFSNLAWSCYAAGFFSSMVFGLIGVKAMFHIYRKGNLAPFVIYCATLGLLLVGIFHA